MSRLSRRPELSYRGALKLLGKYNPPIIEAIDKVAGGAILLTGLASPASAISQMWGWIDQKNEATGLLRELTQKARRRLDGIHGAGRYQLVYAAHTVIALTAFFEALSKLTPSTYKNLELTNDEKAAIASRVGKSSDLCASIYGLECPAPGAGYSFDENLKRLRIYWSRLLDATTQFAEGLNDEWGAINRLPARHKLVRLAESLYVEMYVDLACDVQEFAFLAALEEHGATRSELRELAQTVNDRLDASAGALAGLELLLRSTIEGPTSSSTKPCAIMEALNSSVLAERILPEDALQVATEICFPSVNQIYITPEVRYAWFEQGARPADDNWWDRQARAEKVDLFLASFFVSPEAALKPLIVFGLPGAGKSMLSRVLASRLPAESFTVLRVVLRRVDASATVFGQIQQALELTTSGRVKWGDLVEDGSDTTRVVILDGYDELLQASESTRAGYIHDIEEFQRNELAMGRPVAVVVTSRTLVADRMRIPDRTLLVRVESFDRPRIDQWLSVWNQENRAAVSLGSIKTLPPSVIDANISLASQPLLLLMLAIWAAEEDLTSANPETISGAQLYDRLLTSFISREILKLQPNASETEIASQLEERLWELSVAAFAMFNRGQQFVGEQELREDFIALEAASGGSSDHSSPALARLRAERTIDQFFFIYTAEADQLSETHSARSYEFLHATFGEYLIASELVSQIDAVAIAQQGRRRGTYRVDDGLLFALFSNQVIASRLSIVTFAAQIFKQMGADRQSAATGVLENLLASYSTRKPVESFSAYKPLPMNHSRAIAVYTANLATLRAHLPPPAAIANLRFLSGDSTTHWHQLLRLLQGGLDYASQSAFIQSIDVSRIDGIPHLIARSPTRMSAAEPILWSQIGLDEELEVHSRSGWAASQLEVFFDQPPKASALEFHAFLVMLLLYEMPVAEPSSLREVLVRLNSVSTPLPPATIRLLQRFAAIFAPRTPLAELAWLTVRIARESLQAELGWPELYLVLREAPVLAEAHPFLMEARLHLTVQGEPSRRQIKKAGHSSRGLAASVMFDLMRTLDRARASVDMERARHVSYRTPRALRRNTSSSSYSEHTAARVDEWLSSEQIRDSHFPWALVRPDSKLDGSWRRPSEDDDLFSSYSSRATTRDHGETGSGQL
ncbi:NACHT domain-containing protein [Micromonospora chalcea]